MEIRTADRGGRRLVISNIPELSAIYFALMQCGYDYYAIERSQTHVEGVRAFIGAKEYPFFAGVKQDTCEVYPYWPRAAMLETACFYLRPDHSCFQDFNAFYARIMSAGNIADREREQGLWDWIKGFPAALSEVLDEDGFLRYFRWENEWIAEQNARHQEKLQRIQDCLDVCISAYHSPLSNIQVIVNPIKCAYSADYHRKGNCFIFCSGAFRADSVIHEFLHHVVHPAVLKLADRIAAAKRSYPDIDDSYYLSGDGAGQVNAFEEYAVRKLTRSVMAGVYPESLPAFLAELV